MSEKIGKEAQETFAIHTVTMSFNAMEDRIAMDSADQKGQIERLWLSRRLLDKLIPTWTKISSEILKWLTAKKSFRPCIRHHRSRLRIDRLMKKK